MHKILKKFLFPLFSLICLKPATLKGPFWEASSIYYLRKIFRKTNISNPLICTRRLEILVFQKISRAHEIDGHKTITLVKLQVACRLPPRQNFSWKLFFSSWKLAKFLSCLNWFFCSLK